MLAICLGNDEEGGGIRRELPADLIESGVRDALVVAYDVRRNSCDERAAK